MCGVTKLGTRRNSKQVVRLSLEGCTEMECKTLVIFYSHFDCTINSSNCCECGVVRAILLTGLNVGFIILAIADSEHRIGNVLNFTAPPTSQNA